MQAPRLVQATIAAGQVGAPPGQPGPETERLDGDSRTVLVESIQGREIEARGGRDEVAFHARRQPAEQPGVGGEVRLVLANGDDELAIERVPRLGHPPLAPGDAPAHVPGERLLAGAPLGGEGALGARDVAERGAVGEHHRQVGIVEGRDRDLLQVGQGRRRFAAGEVVVGSRQPQRPGRRTESEQGRAGGQPIPVPVPGGGRRVLDEQVQVRR